MVSGETFLVIEGSAWMLGTEVQGLQWAATVKSRSVWLSKARPCFQWRFGRRPSLPDSQDHQAQITATANLRLSTFRGAQTAFREPLPHPALESFSYLFSKSRFKPLVSRQKATRMEIPCNALGCKARPGDLT